ncbi:MAG: hypothetical protein B5M48_04510 [Candidatus Omnitrophica bacterium 4484_213]|nr:MAG: hypothetical protein B5M48_04510 [Candidatus Omnitrophica bacterium 4484_213]
MSRTKNSPKIFFLEVEIEDKKLVKEKFPQAKIFNKVLPEKEIVKQCREAEVICPFIYSKITRKVIESLPALKLIITRSVGYDHIDLVAANEKGIIICNVPDYGSHVIAEHVFALLLSGLRHIIEGDKRVEQDKKFYFAGLRGIALKGKNLGIIGTGKIGKNVARIASSGFLMNVFAYDPHPDKDIALENHFSYTDLKTVWKKSDIITLHCPLLNSTKHLINKKSISAMKNGVVIVNTSRGGVIDTNALIKGLKSKKISYAFLDVLEHENNIIENRKLVEFQNVIITPHIAFYADDSMGKIYSEAFATINSFIQKKKIINQVKGL